MGFPNRLFFYSSMSVLIKIYKVCLTTKEPSLVVLNTISKGFSLPASLNLLLLVQASFSFENLRKVNGYGSGYPSHDVCQVF